MDTCPVDESVSQEDCPHCRKGEEDRRAFGWMFTFNPEATLCA